MNANRILIAVLAVLMIAMPALAVSAPSDAVQPAYAPFGAIEYTVTFNTNSNNEAYIDVSSMTTVDGRISDLPVPVWKNHTFLGWYTGTGADSEAVSEDRVYTKDTTLFAHWKSIDDRHVSSSGIDFSDKNVLIMTAFAIGALILVVFAALLRLGTRRR